MHDMTVPLRSEAVTAYTPERYFEELKKLPVKRVLIAVGRKVFFLRGEKRKEKIRELETNVRAFQKAGYETGIWTPVLGYGDVLKPLFLERSASYTLIRAVSGRECPEKDAFCPENERFSEDYVAYIRDLASVGADLLVLDDDFCLSVRPGIGCFCEKHRVLYEKALGKALPEGDLRALFFSGAPNEYRRAWLSVSGETMRSFARLVRNAADEVAPGLRIGVSAGYTSWDIEGADALELARILAGKGKPYLRFTGAPYWSAPKVDRFASLPLGAVIEEARAQAASLRTSGAELLTENDSYPRARYNVPSSFLECFALAMETEEGVGELAYLFDYTASPSYETGYLKHRLSLLPLYEFLSQHFQGKAFSGVRVYNEFRKIAGAVLEEDLEEKPVMRRHFHRGAELLAIHGIPTTYEGEAETGIIFGEDARYVNELPKRVILDMKAALILKDRGFDVGLLSAKRRSSPEYECSGKERVILSFVSPQGYYETELSPYAETESEFEADGILFPASYRYESGGREFLVFTFSADELNHKDSVLNSYLRGEQLQRFCRPEAVICHAPGLYMVSKKGNGETALLFVNISADPILDPVVTLRSSARTCTLSGASGTFSGSEIRLDAPVPPYGAFAAVLTD